MCWIMRRLSSLYQFPRRALPKIFSAQFYQREGTQIKPWSYLSISITILGINTRNRRARDSTTRWLHALQAPAEKPRGEKQIWNTLGYLGPCKSILLLGVQYLGTRTSCCLLSVWGPESHIHQNNPSSWHEAIWYEMSRIKHQETIHGHGLSFRSVSLANFHIFPYFLCIESEVIEYLGASRSKLFLLLFLASLSWPGCGECPVPVAA